MARISRLESGRKNLPMFGRDICFNISRRNLGRVLRPDPGREIRASFSCDAAWILGAKSIPTSHVILPGFWARNQYQLSAGFFRFLWRAASKSWRGLLAQNLAAQICLAARWLTILGLLGYPECDAWATLGAAAVGHGWRLTREAEDVVCSSVMSA